LALFLVSVIEAEMQTTPDICADPNAPASPTVHSPQFECTISNASAFHGEHEYAVIHMKEFDAPITVAALLHDFDVSHAIFPSTKAVATVSRTSSIQEALKILFDNRVLSIPVIYDDIPTHIFRLHDLVNLFVTAFKPEEFQQMPLLPSVQKREEINNLRIFEFQGLETPYCVNDSARVLEAVKIMVANKSHRVLVTDQHKHLLGMITQSRIVHLIASALENLSDEVLNKTVEELQIGNPEVVTVKDTQMALEAFTVMRDKNIGAVPVVNQSGSLVGVMSVSDIRKIGYKMSFFQNLGLSVSDYLKMMRSHCVAKMNTKEQLSRPHIVTCNPSDTLSDVIKIMTMYRVHRIFLVDERCTPLRVIGQHDILQTLLPIATTTTTKTVGTEAPAEQLISATVVKK